jgi:hypothetical protein
MSKQRRERALAPSVPALTPQAINDLSPELKRNALELYIRSVLEENDLHRHTANELAQTRGLLRMTQRELNLARADNKELRDAIRRSLLGSVAVSDTNVPATKKAVRQ